MRRNDRLRKSRVQPHIRQIKIAPQDAHRSEVPESDLVRFVANVRPGRLRAAYGGCIQPRSLNQGLRLPPGAPA